jgi:hypothetical protein
MLPLSNMSANMPPSSPKQGVEAAPGIKHPSLKWSPNIASPVELNNKIHIRIEI